MDNTKISQRKLFAERQKAKKFIRKYYGEHGSMPTSEDINAAKVLTPEEVAKIAFDEQVAEVAEQASKETVAAWDYIWDETSWNESYANGVLKDYYVWADGLSPYKEDLWNTVEQRAANWNDVEKDEQGNPIEYEDGYHYINCVRCWLGALNAPGAQYPWCAVRISPFEGYIKWEYEDKVVYPWGDKAREFKRTFAVASVPEELGAEYKLVDGKTTFEPEKLVVTLIEA